MAKNDSSVPAAPALYGRAREILEAARSNIARTVNTTQVIANWLVGRKIVEEEQAGKRRAGYGDALLTDLAERLFREFGKGWSVRQLEYCRSFYLSYPLLIESRNSSVSLNALDIHEAMPGEACKPGQLNSNLSWTHYRNLLRVSRDEARTFYEIEAARNAWSARELERQIGSLLFDRLAKSRDKKGLMRLAVQGQEITQPIDALKDPVVLEFLDLPASPRLVESKLEQALIDNLQTFLLELGKGFAFVSRQERITLDGDHFYIDLVFYHTVLKCFVLIDLKVGKLTHADLGQIQFYVTYYDRERRTEGDNPTLGLILCPDKNDAVVRYTLGDQQERNIFTSRYQLYLPTVEELESEMRRELRYLAPVEAVTGSRKPAARSARKKKALE
ncbi:PDDEXK nuclease domain-containing protein [Propionivibrio sp.]|uniref:PDDEXK nuclease domain-containing protein n=1 Tax=Propionivibrio sp. TaxID=2212460 RepID=UPI002619BA12|nr:PDDEXK nuclease domain-containing protein [Propionivibrio sp.]